MVSVIIVNYHTERYLNECLRSVFEESKVAKEVILVDNNEKTNLGVHLQRHFSEVLYIKAPKNLGFGAGNNLGAKKARGDWLFFLNPDCFVYPGALPALLDFYKGSPETGLISPLLLDELGKPYPLQGSSKLTPLTALIVFSPIGKYFPDNPVSRRFWLKDWDKEIPVCARAVPGTAFMVKRKVFEKLGGFDEKLFLYFEEHDLGERTANAGLKNYIVPRAKVLHYWTGGRKNDSDLKTIFKQSRRYYFRKYYGSLWASLLEIAL